MWRLSESAGQCRVKRQRLGNPSSLTPSVSVSLSLSCSLPPLSLFICLRVSFFIWFVHLNNNKKHFIFLFSLVLYSNFSLSLSFL